MKPFDVLRWILVAGVVIAIAAGLWVYRVPLKGWLMGESDQKVPVYTK